MHQIKSFNINSEVIEEDDEDDEDLRNTIDNLNSDDVPDSIFVNENDIEDSDDADTLINNLRNQLNMVAN